MTDLASLILEVDSSSVPKGVKELDKLTAAGQRAEAATTGVSRAAGRQAGALSATTLAAARQRAGLQQLGQQVGDVANQYSTGSASVQTFAYQVLQATQAVGLMRTRSTGLASFLGGPWGVAMAGAVSLVGALVSGLFKSADASEVAKKRAENYTDALGEQLGALEKVIRSELRLAAIRSTNKAAAAREAQDVVTKAQQEVAAARLFRDNTSRGAAALVFPDSLPSTIEARARVDLEKSTTALTAAENKLTEAQRRARAAQLEVVQATAALTPEQVRLQRQIDKLRESVILNEVAWEKGAPEIVRLQREYNALGQKTEEAAGKTRKASGAHSEHASAAREAAKAAREQAKEIRELQSAYEDLERQFDPAAAKAREFMESMKNIETVRLAGLIDDGKALNFVLAAVFGQAFALEKVIEKLQKDAGFDPLEPIIKVNNSVDDLVDDLQRANDQLLDMASYLQQIGGLAGVIGGLTEGLVTGNFAGLGPTGMLINQIVAGKSSSDKQLAELTKGLQDIFGIGGSFGRTLAGALQGAATGAIAGEAIIGGKTGSSIGAGLGAILGSEFMAAVSGPLAMASAANQIIGDIFGFKGGPLGIFTGLFTSAKKGSASISAGSVSLSGNSGSRKEAAGDAADSVLDALKAIAGELSAQVDSALGSVSIGMRKESWRVDPTGRGRTKGSGVIDFGKDSEAAIAFAVQNLINDGVLKGLRDSTMNLLKNGDFEQQLEKALAFEAVFQQLEAQANPFAAALREMQAGFAELTKVFNEAGATAGEFAVLQELQARRLQELVDQSSSTFRSIFFTDAENLSFAQDQISKVLTPLGFGGVDTVEEYKALVASVDMASQAGLDLFGTLMNLADEFGVVKDAAEAAAIAVVAQAEAVATEARAAAQAADKILSEAQGEFDRATQGVAQAQQTLLGVYRRQREEIEATATRFRSFGADLREFRNSLLSQPGSAGEYRQALINVMRVGGFAAGGNEKALGDLPGTARDFLDISRNNAKSLQQYQRDVAMVTRLVDGAIRGADAQATNAERQLAALDSQVSALVDINDGVVTLSQTIEQLRQAQSSQASAADALAKARADAEAAWRADNKAQMDKLVATNEAQAFAAASMANVLKNIDRGGMIAVTSDADAPVYTSAV